MTVDIVCRVVDNLGDIGFAYRLARALSELGDPPHLRLIVDDLASFAAICPGVDAASPFQTVGDWPVARWEDPGQEAISLFLAERPRMVLECYACGRPSWLESILFDESDPLPRWIVNLEYLTAESWARDYHALPSLTRSPLVRKAIFMPGFQEGTGGLLLDSAFCALTDACATQEGLRAVRSGLLGNFALFPHSDTRSPIPGSTESAFWVLVFSYEHDFSQIVADLAVFHAERPVLALVAAGRSSRPFLEAWNRAGRPFPAIELPLLPQTEWDAVLAASDFAIVRGEESFARACVSGHPFLWECYPFAGTGGKTGTDEPASLTGQLPKVHAFLERIKPFLASRDFAAYERLTLAFNGTEKPDLLTVLRATRDISAGFRAWSTEVRNLGNLAANLLTFMRDLG